MGKTFVRLSPESLEIMRGYDWPGNVRVLENTIERAVAMSTEGRIPRRTSKLRQQRHAHHHGRTPEPSASPYHPTGWILNVTSPTSKRACCNRRCAGPTASKPALLNS